MNDELITSPIFPALFILAVVAFIVFGLTGDYKLGFLTGFVSVISLIIYFKYLDRAERRPIKYIVRIFGRARGFFSQKLASRTSNHGGPDQRSSRDLAERPTLKLPQEKVSKGRFLETIIAAIIIALIAAAVLNLAIYFS